MPATYDARNARISMFAGLCPETGYVEQPARIDIGSHSRTEPAIRLRHSHSGEPSRLTVEEHLGWRPAGTRPHGRLNQDALRRAPNEAIVERVVWTLGRWRVGPATTRTVTTRPGSEHHREDSCNNAPAVSKPPCHTVRVSSRQALIVLVIR